MANRVARPSFKARRFTSAACARLLPAEEVARPLAPSLVLRPLLTGPPAYPDSNAVPAHPDERDQPAVGNLVRSLFEPAAGEDALRRRILKPPPVRAPKTRIPKIPATTTKKSAPPRMATGQLLTRLASRFSTSLQF
jgi:hypothetical protein